jgi:hypothetical protein
MASSKNRNYLQRYFTHFKNLKYFGFENTSYLLTVLRFLYYLNEKSHWAWLTKFDSILEWTLKIVVKVWNILEYSWQRLYNDKSFRISFPLDNFLELKFVLQAIFNNASSK